MFHNKTLTIISNSDVQNFLSRRQLKPCPSIGDENRVIAKAKMWLFFQANKNYLHEDIKLLRDEILESIILGDSLVDAFYLSQDRR